MITKESLVAAFEKNGWKETKAVCPDGTVAVVIPCGYNVTRLENCEYFLIHWDMPWGGNDTVEKVVRELNDHARLKEEEAIEKEKLRAYKEKRERIGWDDESWSFYSDWHKDVYGYRPR